MTATNANRYHISVAVHSNYISEQSQPGTNRYVFAYQITIENKGAEAAQLINRHWVITDANGQVQEVRGAGVVGEQPHLKPGESFQYASGTVLETPIGSMHGSYEMLADNGTHFDAEIPAFSLAAPNSLH